MAIMILGGLNVVGGIANYSKPEWAAQRYQFWVVTLLSVVSVVGGRYMYKNGWREGHAAANVVAVLPAAVLGVLFVIGLVGLAIPQHQIPTDAYGYTEGNKQSFVAGCGGGAMCECFFSALEQNVPQDEFEQESLQYLQTGSFSAEFATKLAEVLQSSGCTASSPPRSSGSS